MIIFFEKLHFFAGAKDKYRGWGWRRRDRARSGAAVFETLLALPQSNAQYFSYVQERERKIENIFEVRFFFSWGNGGERSMSFATVSGWMGKRGGRNIWGGKE